LAVRTGFGFAPCVGWFGDLVLTAAAVATITIGGLGVGRSLTGRPRLLDRRLLPSTPYVAVATAVVAVTSDWLLSRDPLFPTAFALGSSAMATEHVSIATRSAALAIALILLVVPVMATSARERRVGEGLAVGWIAAVAIPSTRVLLTPGHTPDAAFAAGLVLVGLATIALLMWLALSGRTRPPVP
jgi:hypothetical protein